MVDCGCRIYDCITSGYDTKLALELWEIWIIPSLPILYDSLCPGVVVTVRIPCIRSNRTF